MLDLIAEKPVPIEKIASHCGTHFSTVYRWLLHGSKGPDGTMVKLEAMRLGSRWVTTWSALQRFMERTTPIVDGAPAPLPRTAVQRNKASERAIKALAKKGI